MMLNGGGGPKEMKEGGRDPSQAAIFSRGCNEMKDVRIRGSA